MEVHRCGLGELVAGRMGGQEGKTDCRGELRGELPNLITEGGGTQVERARARCRGVVL